MLELINIACNKNTIPTDKSALSPSGLRIGAPAMTTRGMKEADFERIVRYIDRAIQIGIDTQKSLPKEANKLKDWKAAVAEGESLPGLPELRDEVAAWASSFPLAQSYTN